MRMPIDLIVANVMHKAAANVDKLKEVADMLFRDKPFSATEINDTIGRALLFEVAKLGDMSKVYAALKAVGAPCSADDIAEGLRAVKERAS